MTRLTRLNTLTNQALAPQGVPMGPHEALLRTSKRPDQVGPLDAPAAQGLPCCFVEPDQLTTGVKADPVPIKKFVYVGREQQAVGAAQPFAVVAGSPGFDVARHKEFLPCQTRHPAGGLQL